MCSFLTVAVLATPGLRAHRLLSSLVVPSSAERVTTGKATKCRKLARDEGPEISVSHTVGVVLIKQSVTGRTDDPRRTIFLFSSS